MRPLPTTLAVTASVATVVAVLAGPSADAKVVGKEHFTDSFTSDVYDCDGIPAQDSGTVRGNLTVVQRGSGAFPYFNEHVAGSVVTTNLSTGGTFTNVFSANTRDHKITDNGDGTITIVSYAAGGSRFYDQFGKLVLKDPGTVRFAFDVDYNGTPSNPEDDIEVPDSFRIVRPSTGNSDLSGRDFCADLARFTSSP